MENIRIAIYTKAEELPQLLEGNIFHSAELFRMMEQTPGLTPCMTVALRDDGSTAAQLLTTLRRRGSWLPPYLFTQARVYGDGIYANETEREELFALMLQKTTRYLHRRRCFYIEVSDISKKMFGYRSFRQNGFFPIAWMKIHNNTDEMEPELLIDEKVARQIRDAYEMGLETRAAQDEQEVARFYRQLKAYYRFRPQRYIPNEQLFRNAFRHPHYSINVTTYKGHIIGGSLLIYDNGKAYLWFSSAKKRRYPTLHPDTLTIWHAIKESNRANCKHLYFLNVGLPFERNPYREFLLSFGGKPVSTYRWFRFTYAWINKLLSTVYSE